MNLVEAPSNCRALVRELYDGLDEKLQSHPANRYMMDPYLWESAGIVMSPIEQALWSEARQAGIVLYPQYPVGRFFVDFANPAARVAIECDGKEFHQDIAADISREKIIESFGWRVYRISGADCFAGLHGNADVFRDPIERLFLRICSDYKSMETPAMRRLAAGVKHA